MPMGRRPWGNRSELRKRSKLSTAETTATTVMTVHTGREVGPAGRGGSGLDLVQHGANINGFAIVAVHIFAKTLHGAKVAQDWKPASKFNVERVIEGI